MFSKARVRLMADRWTAFSRIVRFVGVNLTGADFAMQVRTSLDQVPVPAALANLARVTGVGAEGVRLVGVTTTDGVPTSEVHIVIAKGTMAAMNVAAASGEAGSNGTAYYDLVIAPTNAAAFVAMAGEFVIEAGSTQSALTGGTGAGGITVIEIADNGVSVVVDGAQLTAEQAAAAQAAADSAQADAERAEAARAVAVASNESRGNFVTKLEAENSIGSVPANAVIRVYADETRGGQSWFYQKIGSAYVSVGPVFPPSVAMPQLVGRSGQRGQIVMVSDDGYGSLYDRAFPILKARGQAMNVAVEIERVGSIYPVAGGLPTITAAQYRELIEAGWQMLNHPNLNTSDPVATKIQKFRDEGRLWQQLLTGAKVATGTAGVFADATPTHPQYDDYVLPAAVWRGGVNNTNSDMAAMYLYDYGFRDVPSGDADGPMFLEQGGPQPMAVTGYVVDTSNRKIEDILNFIRGAAERGTTLILYMHHVVPGPKSPNVATPATPPQVTTGDLEAMSRLSFELGVPWVRWTDAIKGNLHRDPRHEFSSAIFVQGAGDSAGYATSPQLFGGPRHVALNNSVFRGSFNTTAASWDIGLTPFHKYRVTYYTQQDADLVLNAGPANRNHGLGVQLVTVQSGGGAFAAGASDDWTMNGANDATGTYRRPYLANGGAIQRHECILVSGDGHRGRLSFANIQATGLVRVLFVAVEDLGEYHSSGLVFQHTFNFTVPRLISLPNINQTGPRQRRWDLQVIAPRNQRSYIDVTFAEVSDADLPSAPVTGDTVYVLGAGAGAFAGQGGTIATRTAGSGWTFATPANNVFIRVNGLSQGLGGGRRWFHAGRSAAAGAFNEPVWTNEAAEDGWAEIDDSGTVALVSSRYRRTDGFFLIARPVPSNLSGV